MKNCYHQVYGYHHLHSARFYSSRPCDMGDYIVMFDSSGCRLVQATKSEDLIVAVIAFI